MESMYCTKCGAEIKEGNGFCTNCGKRVVQPKNEIKGSNKKQNSKKVNGKKAGMIVASVIGIVAILGGGAFWLHASQTKQEPSQQQQTDTKVAKATAIPTEEPQEDSNSGYQDRSEDLSRTSTEFTQNIELEDLSSGIQEILDSAAAYTYALDDKKIESPTADTSTLLDLAALVSETEKYDSENGLVDFSDMQASVYSMTGRVLTEDNRESGKLATRNETGYEYSNGFNEYVSMNYKAKSATKNSLGEIRVAGLTYPESFSEDTNTSFPYYFEAVFIPNEQSSYDGYSLKSIEISDAAASIKNIKASSQLKSNGSISYGVNNLLDNDKNSAWVEGSNGDGTGESLTISLSEEEEIRGIAIANGYQKSEELYGKNNSLASIEIEFSNGEKNEYSLGEDSYQGDETSCYDIIYFDKSVKTKDITLKIQSVIKGSLFNDACISEIRVLK
ncbi:hypothetical protein lbkm_3976 [Lachnospiraceae bacterium KM106-2]|nr:hypothetical protein lbkm_3976 [Lachnospiraceae bacterium KM106-2]